MAPDATKIKEYSKIPPGPSSEYSVHPVKGVNPITGFSFFDEPPTERITITIAHQDDKDAKHDAGLCNSSLELALRGWRLQDIPARFDVIDTKYTSSNYDRHCFENIACACDLALSRCHTEYLLYTHNDIFVHHRNVLSDIIAKLEEAEKSDPAIFAIGNQLSPRTWIPRDWPPFFGHAFLMIDVMEARKFGLTWSMDRQWNYPQGREIWPNRDTEIAANIVAWNAGRRFVNLGQEPNSSYETPYVFHIRSLQSHLLYAKAGSRLDWYIACRNKRDSIEKLYTEWEG